MSYISVSLRVLNVCLAQRGSYSRPIEGLMDESRGRAHCWAQTHHDWEQKALGVFSSRGVCQVSHLLLDARPIQDHLGCGRHGREHSTDFSAPSLPGHSGWCGLAQGAAWPVRESLSMRCYLSS